MCSSLKEESNIIKKPSLATITKPVDKTTLQIKEINVTTSTTRHGCIQTRYVILLLCCLTNAISYTMRLDLNMTIVAMVKDDVSNITDIDTCPSNEQFVSSFPVEQSNVSETMLSTSTSNPMLRLLEKSIDEGFDWSESQIGLILGSFYFGYICTMVYGGQLADFIGTKLLVALSISACALGTLLIPVSANLHPSLVITVRIITGLAQGVVTPALYTILPKWMPRNELGMAFGLIVAAGNLGAVLTMPICGFLSEYASWPWVFYLFGSVALLFTLPWLYFVYNEPQLHPRISATERVYITSNLSISSSSKRKALVPWKSILTSPKIWAIAVTRFCNGWGSLFLISKLPNYLKTILHMPMTYNGYVNASIYITLGVSSLFWGYVSDVVGRKEWLSKTVSRKMFQSIALLGGAFFLALIPVAGCSIAIIVILLNLSMLIIGLTAGGEFLIVVDVAPNYAGSIYGFRNAIASLPGFLAPLFVGFMLDQPNVNQMKQWNILFFIGAAIYTFGAIVFIFCVNSEPEKWGRSMSVNNQESTVVKSGSISQVNLDMNNNDQVVKT